MVQKIVVAGLILSSLAFGNSTQQVEKSIDSIKQSTEKLQKALDKLDETNIEDLMEEHRKVAIATNLIVSDLKAFERLHSQDVYDFESNKAASCERMYQAFLQAEFLTQRFFKAVKLFSMLKLYKNSKMSLEDFVLAAFDKHGLLIQYGMVANAIEEAPQTFLAYVAGCKDTHNYEKRKLQILSFKEKRDTIRK